MSLRVIGAGVGRTGTASLKVALEHLFDAPCYHMFEVFQHPEHIPAWHQAAENREPDWAQLFDGYAAAVDFPVAAFWPELSRAYPDALVVLTLRDPESWWQSASPTIFAVTQKMQGPWRDMADAMFAQRFTAEINDKAACIAAYERHVDAVRRGVPASRLLEWQVSEGWEPLCKALNLPVPEMPFPRENSRADFLAKLG